MPVKDFPWKIACGRDKPPQTGRSAAYPFLCLLWAPGYTGSLPSALPLGRWIRSLPI